MCIVTNINRYGDINKVKSDKLEISFIQGGPIVAAKPGPRTDSSSEPNLS